MNTHVRPCEMIPTARSDDPLAALIGELAQIRRRLSLLRDEDVKARLMDDDDRMPADLLERQLWEKRKASTTLASHFQATTHEGAVLQALIALQVGLSDLTDSLPVGFLSSHQGLPFRETIARLERSLYSIAYADDDISEDLRLLRADMAPRGFYGVVQVEELDAPKYRDGNRR